MRHTKSPWKLLTGPVPSHPVIVSEGGVNVASVVGNDMGHSLAPGEDHANTARIVACVNACEGIEDPADLRAQRDELLASLQTLVATISKDVRAGCIQPSMALAMDLEQIVYPAMTRAERASARPLAHDETPQYLAAADEQQKRLETEDGPHSCGGALATQYNWESTGPDGCDSHCIPHPCGKCAEEAKAIMSGEDPYREATE